MRFFGILLFFIVGLFENYNLSYLRQCYLKSANNEKSARELALITESGSTQNIVRGYHGAAKIIMAKYYLNPISKLKTFNNGKVILESAIDGDKLNPELRFLRLSIQENSPSFLGYRMNIEQDRLFLKKGLSGLNDDELKTIISSYLNNKK